MFDMSSTRRVCGKEFLVKIDYIFFSAFEETLSKGEEYSEDGPEKMLADLSCGLRKID